MRYVSAAFVLMSVMLFGCMQRLIDPDLTPPAAPQGITTATGDNFIEIFWNRNNERDLSGYNVYVSNSLNGKYDLLATTREAYFRDNGARNGSTYYYAVTAFDFDGNESRLSRDIAYDTPRPEGANIQLNDYRTTPGLAGYDFSTYSIGQFNDKYTDVYYEYYQGTPYLNVWTDSDIQDMGYTNSLYDIGEAPSAGWSPTKDVVPIAGHTYVIWTWDNHYAKIRVKTISASRIVFDWAYQLDTGNPR